MQPGTHKIRPHDAIKILVAGLGLTGILFSQLAWAEAASPSASPSAASPSAGATSGEAKQSSNDAKDTAQKGNQNQLQPDMMGHLLQAMQHRQNAEEARQQQNEGKAQDEDRKADMEQMKANQLNQQMQQNQNSADKNKDRGKKATSDEPAIASQLAPKSFSAPSAGSGPKLDASSLRASMGGPPPPAAPSSPDILPRFNDSIPASGQIATMDDFSGKASVREKLSATIDPGKGGASVKDPGVVLADGKAVISYDSSPAASPPKSSDPGRGASSSMTTTTSTAGGGSPEEPGSSRTAPSPQARLLSSASAGDLTDDGLFKDGQKDSASISQNQTAGAGLSSPAPATSHRGIAETSRTLAVDLGSAASLAGAHLVSGPLVAEMEEERQERGNGFWKKIAQGEKAQAKKGARDKKHDRKWKKLKAKKKHEEN